MSFAASSRPVLAALALVANGPVLADVIEVGAGGGITVLAADHPWPAQPARPAFSSVSYQPALNKAAHDAGVSPALLEALVWQESRWQPAAVSPKGAIGLAQLMPATAAGLGVDPFDPLANLSGGARYLKMQLDRFGDLELALAAYNAGPERVAAARGVPAIAETRAYIDAIVSRIAATNPIAKP